MGQLISGVEGQGCHNFYPTCPLPSISVLNMMKKVRLQWKITTTRCNSLNRCYQKNLASLWKFLHLRLYLWYSYDFVLGECKRRRNECFIFIFFLSFFSFFFLVLLSFFFFLFMLTIRYQWNYTCDYRTERLMIYRKYLYLYIFIFYLIEELLIYIIQYYHSNIFFVYNYYHCYQLDRRFFASFVPAKYFHRNIVISAMSIWDNRNEDHDSIITR